MNKILAMVAALVIVAGAGAAINKGGVPRRDSVAPRSIAYHDLTLETPGQARVELAGDGSSNLDLYVVGPDGAIVEAACGPTDRESATFEVKAPGKYRLMVINRGGAANTYTVTQK